MGSARVSGKFSSPDFCRQVRSTHALSQPNHALGYFYHSEITHQLAKWLTMQSSLLKRWQLMVLKFRHAL
jgi:hypothetical protein